MTQHQLSEAYHLLKYLLACTHHLETVLHAENRLLGHLLAYEKPYEAAQYICKVPQDCSIAFILQEAPNQLHIFRTDNLSIQQRGHLPGVDLFAPLQ